MKRIKIFGKSYYIRNEYEENELIDAYAGIQAGINNVIADAIYIENHCPNVDLNALGNVRLAAEYVDKHAEKLHKLL